MILIPVYSSAISAVGYEGSTLAIVFTSSDQVYKFYGVPGWIYLGLLVASSKGSFYNEHIRGRYS